MARAKKPKTKISVFNWMATLLLCGIPGVNIIAVICFLIFAKSPSKRTFAWALVIWTLIAVIACAALLLALPEEMSTIADLLRGIAASAAMPAEAISIP